MKKIFKKLLIASVAAGTFIFNSPLDATNFFPTVQAEIKTYTGVGKCVQGDLMTEEQAKNLAKIRAETDAKDKAGIYISGYTVVKNSQLTKNDIQVLTNSILNIVGEVQYTKKPFINDGVPLIVHTSVLNAKIDTEGINTYICNKKQFKLQSAQEDIKADLNKIDTLIEHYNKATSQVEKNKIRAEFKKADKELSAAHKFSEGNRFYHQGKYQEAINLYNEALELKQYYTSVYINRGMAYKMIKQYDNAFSDYNRAIELNPNDATIYNNRGATYAELKKYEQAIMDLKKAIELNSNFSEAYNNRGAVYHHLKYYEAALADHNKAIELNPNFAYAYNNRATTYDDLGQYEEAIADYNKALDLNPNDAETYHNRGTHYSDLKNYEQAISDFTHAIEINPNFYLAYYNRAWAYTLIDHFNEAVVDIAKTIEINPNYGPAYYLRGIYAKALGANKLAEEDFAKAKELGYTE